MLFLGTYEYSMDERGRVPLPPRFRDALAHGITLTQGTPDQCVRAYPSTGFEEQAAHYMTEPVTRRRGRMMRRALFATAYQAELDRQGRVLVPTPLRRWAALEGQVVVVGTGEAVEIWSAARFEEVMKLELDELERALESE